VSGFAYAIERTLRWEGGYVNDPDDPGGETKFGISKRAYPDIDIAALTLEQAKAIYHRDYWEPLGCNDLESDVAVKLFDIGVNCGRKKASEILQRAINYLIRRPEEVAVDGAIGRSTIHAANMCNQQLLVYAMRLEQGVHYRELVQSTNTTRFEKYAAGWLRRAME
jgi:lysozyme family protein